MGDAKVIPLVHEGLGTSAVGHREHRHTALAVGTDLGSPERTEELARAQYRSLQRLAMADFWRAAGEPTTSIPIVTPNDISVLDGGPQHWADAGEPMEVSA